MSRLTTFFFIFLTVTSGVFSQEKPDIWRRPAHPHDPAVWGFKEGIVVGLWPYGIEGHKPMMGGGPRGLLRVGWAAGGMVYHLNFIAIEPVVKGKIEFSEISSSKVDDKWGKLIWASADSGRNSSFFPTAVTPGSLSHPDPEHPEAEVLSFFLHIEQFGNGAFPYLQVAMRSDRPYELGLKVFNHAGSALMDRCALTATMGNYARLRRLHLRSETIDSREIYKGYKDVHFIEKETYPRDKMILAKDGSLLAIAETDEGFASLADWPQEERYQSRINWRYRLPFSLLQYWRRSADSDASLRVRVNGRATYWSGGSNDPAHYVPIPGGPAFENFGLQEKYEPGQTFYYGIFKGTIQQLTQSF